MKGGMIESGLAHCGVNRKRRAYRQPLGLGFEAASVFP